MPAPHRISRTRHEPGRLDETASAWERFARTCLPSGQRLTPTSPRLRGRANIEKIRAADVEVWRLGQAVVEKIQAGDIRLAVDPLKFDRDPARDVMVQQIADQRKWPQALVLKTVGQARLEAREFKVVVAMVALPGPYWRVCSGGRRRA